MKRRNIIIVGLLAVLLLWCATAQAETDATHKAFAAGERVTLEGRVTYYATKPAMAVLKLFQPVRLTGIPSAAGPLEFDQCTELQLDWTASKLKKLNKTNVRFSGVLDGRIGVKDRRDVVLRDVRVVKKMANVKSVKIVNKPKSLGIDATWRLGAQVLPKSAPAQVTWVSVNPRVATVDQSGVVTAHERGETEIMLYGANGKEYGYLLKVLGPAEQMWIGRDSVSLQVGKKNQVSIVYYPEYSFEEKVTYSVEDSSVASVDKEGTVTAKKRGFTFLNLVTESGATFTAHIAVYNKGERNMPKPIRDGSFGSKDLAWYVGGQKVVVGETSQAHVMAMFPGGTLKNLDAYYNARTRKWIYCSTYDLPGLHFGFVDSMLESFNNSKISHDEAPYAGTIESSRGIKIGGTWEQVKSAYGVPSGWDGLSSGFGLSAQYLYTLKDDPNHIGSQSFRFEMIDGAKILGIVNVVSYDYDEFMRPDGG